jgi:hypothetical protein
MSTRYRAPGGVTVTLGPELEALVRRTLGRAETAAAEILEREGRRVAAEAARDWYSQVDKESGQSGEIRAVTTITPASVRVDVGSTDRRSVKGKPVVVFVHRPYATSVIYEAVTPAEFFKTPQRMRGKFPTVKKPNPKASDGKFLLQELVKKPVKALKKRLALELGRKIADTKGGSRG